MICIFLSCGSSTYQEGGCASYPNFSICRELNEEEIIWFSDLLDCLQIDLDIPPPGIAMIDGDLPCGEMWTSSGCYKHDTNILGINKIYYEASYRDSGFSKFVFKHEGTHYVLEQINGDLDAHHKQIFWSKTECYQ